MKRKKRIKIILLFLLGISIITYITNFFYHAVNELSDNPIAFEKKAPSDYMNLFSPKARKNLVFQSASSFKLRHTIVKLVYDKKYEIELTRIVVKPNFQIKSDIIVTDDKAKEISPKTKISFKGSDLVTSYNGNSKDTISTIYFSLYGDFTHNYIKNDSVAYYNSDLKNAHIRYNLEAAYEISISAEKKYFFPAEKSVIIMFQKRKDYLYFIILSKRSNNTKLDPYLLYELTHIG